MGGGGAERVVSILANQFANIGNSIIIYTPTSNESFYPLNPSIRILGEQINISKKPIKRKIQMLIGGIKMWFSYQKLVEKEKPDAVISFLTETNCLALIHNHKKYKLIVSERADPTKRKWIIQIITKFLYAKADVLVCQSEKVKRYYNLKNSIVIPNPIDESNLPKKYDYGKRMCICSVGRLSKEKNQSCLIRAFSMIKEKFNDYYLEIYGEGPLRKELQDLIDSLHLNNRIKLMGAHKDVLEKIKDTSLFVMSSDYEGFPNALVEAMAIGLPVICTDFDSGTAKELVKKENGLLVPVGDTHALAKAMEYMLENTELRKSMSMENIKIRDRLAINEILNKWNNTIA